MKNLYSGVLIIALSFIVLEANAETEFVYVYKVMDDDAIVIRENKQAYLIEKGVGCLSLWRYEGKSALITSPGLFLGVGTKLILPDEGQQCRVWDFKALGSMESPAKPSIDYRGNISPSGCSEGHWIKSNMKNGEIIILEDNSVWQVDNVDRITSSLWLPISDITVCDSIMINIDDGEKVKVTKLK